MFNHRSKKSDLVSLSLRRFSIKKDPWKERAGTPAEFVFWEDQGAMSFKPQSYRRDYHVLAVSHLSS